VVIFFLQKLFIEDFIQDIAGIRTVDPIELLFEFYDVYLSVTEKQTKSFEIVSIEKLLQDFNEIDRYVRFILCFIQTLTY
jgi:hypothetical protein